MKKKQAGQALIEYITIFAFMGLFAVNMVRVFSEILDDTAQGLAFNLTQQLSIGVCQTFCFHSGYKNENGGP